MFSGMFFQKEAKVDKLGRLFLPSEIQIEAGKDIVITRKSQYYELYLLETLNKIVDELQKGFYFMEDAKRVEILRDLNYLFAVAVRTSKVDAQRRISVPMELRENKVILQGRGNSIALFPDRVEYDKYMESIEPSKVLG